jgi:hypothetical protein
MTRIALVLLTAAACGGQIEDLDADTEAALARKLEHGIMGMKVGDVAHFDSDATLIQRAGLKWVRTGLPWCALEWTAPVNGQHQYNWNSKGAEDLYRTAKAHGLKVMVTLDCVPPWAHCDDWGSGACHGKDDRIPPSNAQYLYQFARDAAAHYGDLIDAYDVWNEPGNETWFYIGSISDWKYKILKPAFEGFKAGNPNALVVGPSNFSDDKNGAAIGSWVMDGGKMVVPLDRVTIHAYPGKTGNVDVIKMRMAQANGWCKAHSKICPGFWVTETGLDSSIDGHGRGVDAIMRQCQYLGRCEHVFLFHLHNLPTTPWTGGYENYGLTKRDGTIKPRYCGVQKYLLGYNLVECGGSATEIENVSAEVSADTYYHENTQVPADPNQ